MFTELTNIATLLESFLGDSKKGIGDDTQMQFNCPMCASEKGMFKGDGKYNLEVNIKKNVFKCWSCGDTHNMSGRISKLIRMFGNENILNEYKRELYQIRQSKLYELKFLKTDFNDEDDEYEYLSLPDGFRRLSKDDAFASEAYAYLRSRGINDHIIEKHRIGYTPKTVKDGFLKERIFIPSYDSTGSLSYWVGRDYRKKTRRFKYANPDSDFIKKTDIVFNEGLVNWFEDITLVEGPFDHIVVPNSIPLLGKVVKKGYAVYDTLMSKAKANVNIFLDDDAEKDAMLAYHTLNTYKLYGRVRIIPCPQGYDASSIFEKFGVRGIRHLLRQSFTLTEYQSSKFALQ